MTGLNATEVSLTTGVAPANPFTMLGDASAAACIGDVCEIPQTAVVESEHAIVNRQLDEDRV